MKIEERLDLLKNKLKEKRFLKMKGLGNEIPFYIFDYPPEKESLVRFEVKRIINDLKDENINILDINLYFLALDLIKRTVDFERVVEMELKKGSDELLDKLMPIVKPELILSQIMIQVKEYKPSLIFITGVGNVWPIVRSHKILNNLQVILKDVPLIMFYPGEYTKSDLSLFGKLNDGNYYRAFRLIDYVKEAEQNE